MVKNSFKEKPEKKYRVSRESSTQGIYFETNKGDSYALKKGKQMWDNQYGRKPDDLYVQVWEGESTKRKLN